MLAPGKLNFTYSKTCVKQPLSKRPQNGFQDELLLNAGQKYCRMLQREHSAILSTFIKLPFVTFVIKIFFFCLFLSGPFTQVLLYLCPDFYGDLVYKLKKIVGSNNFSAQFIKIISHYKKIGYNINVLQQTACLVVNPITVGNFAFLFNCKGEVGAVKPV